MSQFPGEPLDLSSAQGFGYFPAYPGLTLKQNRYKVLRKLGFGPRSSVWLVLDLQGDNEYCALKILTAHFTTHKTQELRTLQTIQQASLWGSLALLHDHFVEQSHHGKHQCLALSVLGPDIESLRLTSPTKALPVNIVQKAIAEISEALSDLHDNEIIHGAVKADNFLFFAGQTARDLEPVLARLPPSVIERKVTVGGIEYPIVLSQPIPHGYQWNSDQNTFANSGIYLNNMAHSQTTTNNPTWEKAHVDVSLQPPEAILGTAFDTKVDIWMLGCATYQLLTGEPLIPYDMTEHPADQLGWMMAMAGDRVKEEMALKSEHRGEFFDENGIFEGDIPETSLTARLTATGKVAKGDIPEIVHFIEKCLSLDPEDRPSACDLRDESWLRMGFACSCGYCG